MCVHLHVYIYMYICVSVHIYVATMDSGFDSATHIVGLCRRGSAGAALSAAAAAGGAPAILLGEGFLGGSDWRLF